MTTEFWQKEALNCREIVGVLAFKAVDLILMPSQETYNELRMMVLINFADTFKASEELPDDYTKENAKFLLDRAKNEMIRHWRTALEVDKDHADEAREWLDNKVIGAALAMSRDEEKAKVSGYLDELKEVKPHELLRGR